MCALPAAAKTGSVVLRRAAATDVERCGHIAYEAFRSISERHGFPADFASPEVATEVIGMVFGNPGFYCVVAEQDGRVVGSNGLDERNPISGIGPVTIDPAIQDRGIGRKLMEAVVQRSDERGFPGVRLVQAAYHMRSLSLYTKLGFAAREQLVVMEGAAADDQLSGYEVRPLRDADIAACNGLCTSIHGFPRDGELRQATASNMAFVAEENGAVRGYTTGLGYFGHSVGETTAAICALLAKAPRLPGLGVLIPTRNYPLFRWCLDHGMRAVMTMTLMTRGIYQEPDGPYLPSILY
jgi:GNAT superfamily N-acetyltransferase